MPCAKPPNSPRKDWSGKAREFSVHWTCTSCQEVHREESRQAKLLNARDFATGAGKGGLWKLCRKHLHL
ncbi:hypothetical protein [Prevotella nigrescens]|nr:hypothetical protein [Prevotella nigrescens]MBW4727185.1 hypothetical protein [Prevotella nigrescens]